MPHNAFYVICPKGHDGWIIKALDGRSGMEQASRKPKVEMGNKMFSTDDRKEKIAQLTNIIEELQSEDEKFADIDKPTYENAIRNLQEVIAYHEREINK